MNDASSLHKAALTETSPGSGSLVPAQQPYMNKPIASRHVWFYKSGDAQFTGLPVVINNRTFKTFEALLDTLSKRIPLPFGVRTITTPRGRTTVHALDQLQHGHSYICSDKRTVKPIDLEQARHRPPPWYHPRPVSSRRLRERPHPHNAKWNTHAALLHTPKRLVIFRNGDPEVKRTLLLKKRTTYSFEALIGHISEIMHFPVRRLHTPDGRRVDGLPALILCPGVLVAAGREPFRKGNYDILKPFAPTLLPAERVGRLNPATKKKKSSTSSTKSRAFSPSSEPYLENQLQKSFAESAHDNMGSVEMGTGRLLESVADTDAVTCMDGDSNDYVYMPKDDDIEKSFRVNQDGSMTVEMKVRLTVKEEETVRWTTTLSRQNATSHMQSVLEPHSDLGAVLADRVAPDVDADASAIRRCPEEYSNVPTKECRDNVQKLGTSKDEANSEQEQCLLGVSGKCIKHPVPKPRNVDISQFQAGMFKSAEVLQLQDSGQETHLRIFEHQTCQKSFLANTEFITWEIPTSDAAFSASPDTIVTSSGDLKSEQRPAIVYSSLQKQENVLPSLGLQTARERNMRPEIKRRNSHTPLPESFKPSSSRTTSAVHTRKEKKKIRVIVKKSHIVHVMTRDYYRENDNKVLKDEKTEQHRTKSIRKSLKSTETKFPKRQIKSLHGLSVREHCTNSKNLAKADKNQRKQSEHFTLQNKHLCNVLTIKYSKTRPASTQGELKETPLPALHSPSSVLNEYVELWLQKSEREPAPDQKQPPSAKPSQELVITCEAPGSKPHVPLDGSSTSYAGLDNNLATHKNVSLKREIIQFPQSGKQDSNADEPLGKGLRSTKYRVRPTCLTREPSLEKTPSTESSMEQIPKNNTLSKASLFSNRDMGDAELSGDAVCCKKSKPPSEKALSPEVKSYSVKMAVRPDMRHVLDQLCHSIRSLCEATQQHLKNSNSMPDFSSHLASTFGSSSRVFLAYLSVMTLRHGLENRNAFRQAENNLSCSEALHMLQSLKAMVGIGDAERLRIDLNALKNSASHQLLQSWKGFQHLSDACMSSGAISGGGAHSVSGSEEEAIQRLTEELGVPDRVREELAAFPERRTERVRCHQAETSEVKSCSGSSLSRGKDGVFSDGVLKDIKTYVKCVIEKAASTHSLTDTEVVTREQGVNSNMCELKQQRIDEVNVSRLRNGARREQSEVTHRTVTSKDDCVGEDNVMETAPIHSDKEMEDMDSTSDASEINKGGDTEVYPKLSEKRSIFEDRVGVKEILETDPRIEPQTNWRNEGVVNRAHTRLHGGTEGIKRTGLHTQNTSLAVGVEHGTQDEVKKLYARKQQMNVDNEKKHTPREAAVCGRKAAQAKRKNGSVAKPISNLETCTQRPSAEPAKPVDGCVGHPEVSDPDNVHEAFLTGNLKEPTLEANSSSLAFSYDSQCSSAAQESGGSVQANRVKFIRDMFLARSQTRTQSGHRQLHSPNSDLSESQPRSTDSGGNWSQETSSGEDDASRLAIAKGFVRRAIDRLYGGASAENTRSPSAMKAKQREGPGRASVSSLASYHEARTRETVLSYFSATNRSDFFNMPTEFVTQNKQVWCGDANSVVKNQIHESASKLQESQIHVNNQTVSLKPKQHSGQEDFPHKTQPSTKPKKCPGSPGSTFTYFNLPNASDSELEPEAKGEVEVVSETQAHKSVDERNSFILAFSPTVLKIADNKVHPLAEGTTPHGVKQPVKGQSAPTGDIKQSAEPDALEMLFVFCGQRCPIL